MKFTILTLFPQMFIGPINHSIVKRAQEKGMVKIECINIRDFAKDKYKTVDDHPYGGGVGMIMKVDVVDKALQHINISKEKAIKILLDPKGKTYTQKVAKALTKYEEIVLVCGHYEGVDERVRSLVNETISIGNYIVTGGELPAMIIIDSVTRLIPGVLPQKATTEESFTDGLLEYPQYTRPFEYKGMTVPEILLSGNHATIQQWRNEQAVKLTKKKDLDELHPEEKR
jgi:tRNA (guanine37-N1)-methyltransferase